MDLIPIGVLFLRLLATIGREVNKLVFVIVVVSKVNHLAKNHTYSKWTFEDISHY